MSYTFLLQLLKKRKMLDQEAVRGGLPFVPEITGQSWATEKWLLLSSLFLGYGFEHLDTTRELKKKKCNHAAEGHRLAK